MMRWLRGSTATGTPGAEEEIGKENIMPMASENKDTESTVDEVESSATSTKADPGNVEAAKKPVRNTPRRASGKSKKSAPAKSSPMRAATPLRRSTRAKSRKSEGFFDAAQEATPDPMATTPNTAAFPTPLHPEFSAADEEAMLQDLESPGEMEVPEQLVIHNQTGETAVEGGRGEAANEVTEVVRETTATQEGVVVQEIAVGQETAASQETEDRHSVQLPTPAFDRASQEPTQVETEITTTPDPTASNAPPTQAETAITSSPARVASNAAPSTSVQPAVSFTTHRAIRPGGLLTSKYAEAPAVTVAPPSGPTSSIATYAANHNSAKRQLVEDDDEGPAGYMDERSAKRMRTTHSRESTSDRSTPHHHTFPSTISGHEWVPLHSNMRDRQDPGVDSDREETPERSAVNPDIMDTEPFIKQEPADDLPINPLMNPPKLSYSTPLTPAQSISPGLREPPVGPRAAQRTTPQASVSTSEQIDLFQLCIPQSSHPTQGEISLIRELERKTIRILRGEKDKVDIRSRLPAWMREGMSARQSTEVSRIQKRVNAMQQSIRGSKAVNQRRNDRVQRASATPNGSSPAPMRTTPAPFLQNQQRTPLTVAPTLPQAQLLPSQQARQSYGLEPLEYGRLAGPALVYSALEQVNNMLEAFGVNKRCMLSGLDKIKLQSHHGIVPLPPPAGCTPLSLSNMPSTLFGPALANHALQQVNEMTKSFWPGQFVLHGAEVVQLQS